MQWRKRLPPDAAGAALQEGRAVETATMGVQPADLRQVIGKTLAASTGPLTATALRKQLTGPYQVKVAQLTAALSQLVELGQARLVSPPGKTAAYWNRDPRTVAREAILAELASHDLNAAELLRAIKPLASCVPATQHKAILSQLLDEGRVFEHPAGKAKKDTKLSLRPFDRQAFAGEQITREVAKKDMTAKAAHKRLAALLPDSSHNEQAALIDALCATGKLFWHPAPKGEKKLSAASVDPAPFLEKHVQAIKQVAAELATYGLSADQVLQAAHSMLRELFPASCAAAKQPSPVSPAERHLASPAASQSPVTDDMIVERMCQMQPNARSGAFVMIADLRRALDFQYPSKVEFDAALLRLAERGVVALHQHDHPQMRPAEERASFVTDGSHFFNGVSLRL